MKCRAGGVDSAPLSSIVRPHATSLTAALMLTTLTRFVFLMALALLVGSMFGIWVGFNPTGLSASAYIEQQQSAIRSLNTLLPVMGATCILLAVLVAALAKRDMRCRILLGVAVVLLFAAALVTRFENQPINAVVMTWNIVSPAANWAQLRDEWWQWHIVRTIASIAALAFALAAILGSREPKPRS